MKKIVCSDGKIVLVSDEDHFFLSGFNWHFDGKYARTTIKGKFVRMHELILKSNEYEVDHKDRDKLNNQRENLRKATRSQNNANRGKSIANTSGFKGVRFYKNKWMAEISVNNKNIYLGRFITKEEAIAAYNYATKQYYGEFSYVS